MCTTAQDFCDTSLSRPGHFNPHAYTPLCIGKPIEPVLQYFCVKSRANRDSLRVTALCCRSC
jgi:hypothetical protein